MSVLTVTVGAVERLLAEVKLHGAETAETGAFLIGRGVDPGRLELIALPDGRGIRRARDLFEVSGGAIESLFTWAADGNLMIRAQVHSHRRSAFLSRTDLQHGFSVDGFVSCVIPWYEAPPADPQDWAWWECRAGCWNPRSAPALQSGGIEVVRFDAEGVRGG